MKKLSDCLQFEKNPFESAVKNGKKSVSSKKIGEIYNTITGELISDNVSLVVTKSIDKGEFIKLFTSKISSLFTLEASELKVFLFLLKSLEINTGRAYFNLLECRLETKFAKATIYRALFLLCTKNIIARSEDNSYYWVNPAVAFNGNRMSIKIIDNESSEIND